MIKIGLFALKDGVGCTAESIHIANYFASSDLSVALIEAKTTLKPEYDTVKADFDEDGTFVLNSVRYYPVSTEREPDEDIQIIDFGKVDYIFEFDKDFDKLYICCDDDIEAIADIKEFMYENNAEFEVLLFGGSKETLATFSDNNFHAMIIPSKKEERIDQYFANRLNIVLMRNDINPPKYHANWTYAPTIFHYVPEQENKKKGLFGLFGGKKNEEEIETNIADAMDEMNEDEEDDDIWDEDEDDDEDW